MKIDSEHLEILAVIVEKGGLTEGAEALGKSQPSVSRTMALLEERVGTPLFEAGRRPLRPTELGNQLARSRGQNQNSKP
ncbi:helix-turn-helix domain-containing protein [Agrobacterium vitis]|uniref:helix-turn-helix domain-containing protein n=1 Tax=Agrobacterium vitis TaxID=373 RepID=UPI003D2E3FF6